MAANALVQTRIDPVVKEKAAAVLADIGLTVSDVVRIVLTRTANEGELPFALQHNTADHDARFRARVQDALKNSAPGMASDRLEQPYSVKAS
jgi:DNA-damage-inducible protein J